ncbi:serine hydrolase [Streptomyces sp. NPDC002889]|uniref:D-alanyl-D-alanine carboxypeptidase n=1 Tax=Streptomyces sp. NPDC002889 TaxID=3364669 RepID=UPI00368432B0
MAGESPDRSEQGKSSGETTQGERDPRLAVFRQAPPKAEPVDQPTAVFTTRPRDAEPDPSPEEPAPSGNDARLRAAVAAWVATADEPTPAEEPSDAQSSAADAATVESPATDEDDEDAVSTSATSDAQADEEADTEADEASADRPAAARSAQETPDAPQAPAPAGKAASATEPTAAEAKDPAASVSAGDELDTAADASGTQPTEGPAAEETSATTTPDSASPASGSADEAGPGASDAPEAPDQRHAQASGDAKPVAASADDPAAPGVKGAATTLREAESGDADEAGSQEASQAPRAASDDDAGAGRVPDGEGPSATTSDDADGVDDADGAADARPRPSWAQQKASAGEAHSGQKSAGAKPESRPVDQPTAIFKTPRKPVVDQPTTALKMPAKPPAPPESTSDGAPDPAPEARRSSTFVPLRTDDAQTAAPAAPKPAAEPAAAEPASLSGAERTKQQPLPPLPPLDLLAELTNTPPPPETPVRTVVRRVKIWTPLVVLLLIVFAVVQLVRPLPDPQLALSAEKTFTFEGGQLGLPWPDEGQGAAEVVGVGSLGTYGAQKPAPIASVAKTMTAYVILRDHPIKGKQVGPKITVDQQAEDESKIEDESTAAISKGQQFTERQMLQLLMIPSGNNAARLLARWDAKSEAAFVEKMNDAAKDLGMTGSTYTDPSGLKSTTVSTPQDQLKLAKAVMEYDVFREIVNTTKTRIPGIAKDIRNNNDRALLLDGVGGIKTGSSTPAGGNLLWTANALVDGKPRRIVGVVMGAQNADLLWQKLELAIDYSIEVIQAAQEGVTSATVVKKGDVVGYVDDRLGGRTPVVATKDLKAVGWAGLKVEIDIESGDSPVPHSAKAGTVVGDVFVGSGPGRVSAPVELQRDLAEPGVGSKLSRLG